MKNLMLHVAMRGVVKSQEDEEPVRAWKDLNADNRLMHPKIGLIASKLGIFFYCTNMQNMETGGTNKRRS